MRPRVMRRLLSILLLSTSLQPLTARADDLADEADLQFDLGTKSYRRGDYTAALEHFLASNRLVPNPNAAFNIARTYERLGKFPEAFRNYDSALSAETDPKARLTIQNDLDRIRPQVSLLEVITDPPGATIYLDRKDLGPRGSTPRTLALQPGHYRVIVELENHNLSVLDADVTQRGHTAKVSLNLSPLRGLVRFQGQSGLLVHAGASDSKAECVTPCDLRLDVGEQPIHLSRRGFAPSDITVVVDAERTRDIRPKLTALAGSLVVNTDEPGARIEVDDRIVGFSPSITNVNAGRHKVTVSLSGYRVETKDVEIVPNRDTKLELELTREESVQAVSRRTQTVENAPSSVSIVSRQEITGLAYPTIAEALKGRPGVYFTDDRAYVGIGIRGLGRLGSYGNRVLVLQDGIATNDDWIGSAFVGYDAMSDLGDVERIELVRGPGSVVYGTAAFSGVVNVVTRDVTRTSFETAVDSGYANVARARGRANYVLGPHTTFWTSVAAVSSQGSDFFIPEYSAVTPPNGTPGLAKDLDGFHAGTLRGRLRSRWLTASWFLHSHTKHYPGAQFDTIFGDPRGQQTDTRGFFELKAEPTISNSLNSLSRIYLNRYVFSGQYPHVADKGGFEVDAFRGHWAGAEQRFTAQLARKTSVAFGGEFQWHFDVVETTHTNVGYVLNDAGNNSKPFTVAASYVSLDGEIAKNTNVSLGTRLDHYSTFGSSVNPRLALMVKPWSHGNFKFMMGRAFRAPSVYELYYNDGGATQIPNPTLNPETIYSGEVEYAHQISPTVAATFSTWINAVHDLIDMQTVPDNANVSQFVNTATPIAVIGSDLSLRRDWRQGWMLEANYGLERAEFLRSQSNSDLVLLRGLGGGRHVSNVPAQNIALRAFMPILERRLLLGTRFTFVDQRWTRYEAETAEHQRMTNAALLWDVVLSGREERTSIGYYIGVYNIFDWRYSLPVGFEFGQTSMPQLGRSIVAGMSYRL
jgi:outer membrane cobalamin receptor